MSTTPLPAVTLTDPWASLVVAGIKTLETRTGAILSGFSGPLVIHRSKAPVTDEYLELAYPRWRGEPWSKLRQRPAGWPDDDAGCALGIVYVERTWRTLSRPWMPDYADLQRRACFDDIGGRYLSELTRATWFPAPLPARGMQCRFSIDVPTAWLPGWAR